MRPEDRRRRRTATAAASAGPNGPSGWEDKDDDVEVVEVEPAENDEMHVEADQLETWRQLLQIPGDGTPPGVQALPVTVQAAIQQATVIASPEEMVSFMQGFSRFISLLIAEVSRAIHRGQGEQKALWTKRDDKDGGADKDENTLMQMPGLPAIMASIKQQLHAQPADKAHRRTQALMAQLRLSAYRRFRRVHLERRLRFIEASVDGPGISCDSVQELDAEDTKWATEQWQLVSAALGRAMVATAGGRHSPAHPKASRKRKQLERMEQMEWEGTSGLYITARDPATHATLAMAHLEVPQGMSAMQVTVRYQKGAASSADGTSAQAFGAIMPLDMGPVEAPMVFQPGQAPDPEEGTIMDYFAVWSQGLMSDDELKDKIGEEGLRLYQGVRAGLSQT